MQEVRPVQVERSQNSQVLIKSEDDRQSMEVYDDEGQEDGNGEGEEEYKIEAILDAKRGLFPNGRLGYLVKWKGYNTSENSWVDEQDVMHVHRISYTILDALIALFRDADGLIDKFWTKDRKNVRKSLHAAKSPKKRGKSAASEKVDESSTGTKKRGRKSQSAKEPLSEDRTVKRAKKDGATIVLDKDPHPLEDEDELEVGDMSAYMSDHSWEHLVQKIETVEHTPDGLRVYFTL
ncbi:hypothetical protein C0993_008651, partial [Termitomyces sp. T159_Od127]